MAAPAPVEVGTQGTVASLVCREIEYFRGMEAVLGHGNKSGKLQVAASGGSPTVKKPKKKGANGGAIFLPRMCSSAAVAEVARSGRKVRPARVRYRHLEEEGDFFSQPQE